MYKRNARRHYITYNSQSISRNTRSRINGQYVIKSQIRLWTLIDQSNLQAFVSKERIYDVY